MISYLDLIPLSTHEMSKFYGGLGNLVTNCCGCHATMYNPGEWKCDGCMQLLKLIDMDWITNIESDNWFTSFTTLRVRGFQRI
jgi:hypothetical protein